MVEARIFVNKIPIYGHQHKTYTIMSRLVTIVAVIRSYSRHVDGSDVEYQGTITAFSEPSRLLGYDVRLGA